MANQNPQNLKNHVRVVPPFHMFALPVLMLNAGWSIYHLVKAGISFESILGVLVAFALLTALTYTRLFVLTVPDRVIRLEMRLRLSQILPPDFHPPILVL